MQQLEIQIGKAAGEIWKTLSSSGSMSRSKIAKTTGLSTQLTNQGIGWLAREGKISHEKKGRAEFISLKE